MGLTAGVAANLYLWLAHAGQVNWMWWNLVGFTVCLAVGTASGGGSPYSDDGSQEPVPLPWRMVWLLCFWFAVILAVSVAVEYLGGSGFF